MYDCRESRAKSNKIVNNGLSAGSPIGLYEPFKADVRLSSSEKPLPVSEMNEIRQNVMSRRNYSSLSLLAHIILSRLDKDNECHKTDSYDDKWYGNPKRVGWREQRQYERIGLVVMRRQAGSMRLHGRAGLGRPAGTPSYQSSTLSQHNETPAEHVTN